MAAKKAMQVRIKPRNSRRARAINADSVKEARNCSFTVVCCIGICEEREYRVGLNYLLVQAQMDALMGSFRYALSHILHEHTFQHEFTARTS